MSKKYELNKKDMIKIGKGAMITLLAALFTYLAQIIPGIDFGTYSPTVTALLGIFINTARKYFVDIRGD